MTFLAHNNHGTQKAILIRCHLLFSMEILMKELIHRFATSMLIALLILNSIVITMACSDNTIRIKSLADSGMGYWIKNSDVQFEYKISNMNKEKIYRIEMKKSEKTRNSKILLGIMYITDIDSAFLIMNNGDFGLDLNSKNTLIEGRDKNYLIIFEEYKSIYFPKTISIENK